MAQTEDETASVEVAFPAEDIRELDAWIAEHGTGLTRPDAIKRIVKKSIAIDREWQSAKRVPELSDGARPETAGTGDPQAG
jgi:hypothetical protein